LKITDLSYYKKGAKLINVIKKIKAEGAKIIYKPRDGGRLKVYSIREKELVINGPDIIVGEIKRVVENGD